MASEIAERLRAMNTRNFGRINVREIDPPKHAPEPVPRFMSDLDETESDEVLDDGDEQQEIAFRPTEPAAPALTPLQVARAHMQQQEQLKRELLAYRSQCESRIEATRAEIGQVNEALAALGHVEASDDHGA